MGGGGVAGGSGGVPNLAVVLTISCSLDLTKDCPGSTVWFYVRVLDKHSPMTRIVNHIQMSEPF